MRLCILVGKAQNHIEIDQRLYELLVAQVGNTSRVIRVWQVGPKVYGVCEVANGIFVVAHLGAHNATIVVGLGVDWVDVERARKVLLGTQQVAQPQLGIATQVVGLVGLFVATQEHIEDVYGLFVVVACEHIAACPSNIALVVLSLAPLGHKAQHKNK